MSDFVVLSGAGSQLSGLMLPTASGSCADVLASVQAVHDQVLGANGYQAVSCTNDPVVIGTQIQFSPSLSYAISSIGSFQQGSFLDLGAFDPSVGGALFVSVVSSVLILYLSAKSVGTVLSFLKGK